MKGKKHKNFREGHGGGESLPVDTGSFEMPGGRWTRRGFLKKSWFAFMTSALGGEMVYARNYPSGLIPALFSTAGETFLPAGKNPGLRILNDRPWNVETPPHLLDDAVTPADKLFIRNNGRVPPEIDPNHWELAIEGESAVSPRVFSLAQLKSEFKHHTYQLTLECAGNGRNEFNPPARGNQWSTGAVGCPEWTGVRLWDVLERVGVRDSAVYIGYYGKDIHLSGDLQKAPISRGVPLYKALEKESLIAWAMNGQPLPLMNGFPLRLVFGGWPGSTSGKWLHKIVLRDKVHDGVKMGGNSYRVPRAPVAPGSKVPDEDMRIIEAMPVKSLITHPKSGAILTKSRFLGVRGHAWVGDLEVAAMDVSIDFGVTWKRCILKPPRNRLAWQHWNTVLEFPRQGYYEVWGRATDSEGRMQPMVVPGWNPKGYLNNACHRIAVKVV